MVENDNPSKEELVFDKSFLDSFFAKEKGECESFLDLPGVRLRFYLIEMIFLEIDNLSKREIGNIPNTRRF